MRLTIDNLDGAGVRDYTAAFVKAASARVTRKLNAPSTFTCEVTVDAPQFVVPKPGARLILQRDDGTKLFTGYITDAPEFEYRGWRESGPVYRYSLRATSDEFLLDRHQLPVRAPLVSRTAGAILKQL